MSEALLGSAVEILTVVAYAAVTAVLTVAGVLAEQAGIAAVGSDLVLGIWLLGMGTVALVGAYLLATGRLLPRVRALAAGR